MHCGGLSNQWIHKGGTCCFEWGYISKMWNTVAMQEKLNVWFSSDNSIQCVQFGPSAAPRAPPRDFPPCSCIASCSATGYLTGDSFLVRLVPTPFFQSMFMQCLMASLDRLNGLFSTLCIIHMFLCLYGLMLLCLIAT